MGFSSTLCPVRSLRIYSRAARGFLNRRGTRQDSLCVFLKPKKQVNERTLACILKKFIHDAYLDAGIHKEVSIGPHQMRKLGASCSFQVDQDADTVRINMGFRTFSILIKNFVAEIPN